MPRHPILSLACVLLATSLVFAQGPQGQQGPPRTREEAIQRMGSLLDSLRAKQTTVQQAATMLREGMTKHNSPNVAQKMVEIEARLNQAYQFSPPDYMKYRTALATRILEVMHAGEKPPQ